MSRVSQCLAAGAINVQPGNVQPWWIRYSLVLFQEGKDFDSLACLRRLQSKFEGVAEVRACVTVCLLGCLFACLVCFTCCTTCNLVLYLHRLLIF